MDPQSYCPLVYSPTTRVSQLPSSPQIDASLTSSWHPSPGDPSPSTSSPHMYPLSNGTSDHIDYPSLSSGYIPQNQAGPYNASENQSLHPSPLHQDMPPDITQVEPGRVLTRRQRALLQQNGQRPSEQSSVSIEALVTNNQQSGVYFVPPETSSPHTPPQALVERPELHPTPSENSSLNIDASPLSLQVPSASFSSPATSTASPYSPYGVNTAHSRSTSTSNSNPRSTSPALSAVSALTSVSSVSAPPPQALSFALPDVRSHIAPRQKHRKQHLCNKDRKVICEYHRANPNARQEDIASRFHVERSTISKILKYKTKWLSVPDHDNLRVAKHRPSKFPEIEVQLEKWLVQVNNTIQLTDALIRQKAREIAQKLSISEEKFKASSGWVENFKHRQGIRGGIWTGEGKNHRLVNAFGPRPPGDPPIHARPTYRPDLIGRAFPGYNGTIDPSFDPTRPPYAESVHRGHPMDPSRSLDSSWQCPPEPQRVLPPPVYSMDRSHLAQMHHSPTTLVPDHCLSQPHPQQLLPYGHSAIPPHESTDETNLHTENPRDPEPHHNTPTYDEIMRLQLAPPQLHFRPDAIPTIGEAEEACEIVMRYLHFCQPTLLRPDEREVLRVIKTALLQISSGLPFDRRNL